MGASWRIEVVAATGTLTTPELRLSSIAAVWLSEARVEIPSLRQVH